MKTNNKTTKAIRLMGAGLLAAAIGSVLLLNGCAGSGGGSTASATVWPPATPPATTQKNTYLGTQGPGWYTITIDHTNNTFSYQDLSTNTAAVSGSFTTTPNGFLALSSGGYAVEMLSRAVLLTPAPQSTSTAFTVNAIFAVAAPSCQTIPSKTKFVYLATPNPYYANNNGGVRNGINENLVSSGTVYASTDSTGANWTLGGEVQYELPLTLNGVTVPALPVSPTPDPVTVTCANNGGVAEMQTAITVPDSVPTNFAVGPTGFFVEDSYAGDQTAFVGSVEPSSPVDLTGLKGATFLGMNGAGGEGTTNNPGGGLRDLIAASAALDSSGTSIQLTVTQFPANDPSQTPVPLLNVDLGAQDPNNNGYFSSGCVITSSCSPGTSYAVVTQAGGKYAIFVVFGSPANGSVGGFLLFQQ